MLNQASYAGALKVAQATTWKHRPAEPLEHRVLDRLRVALAVIDARGLLLFCNSQARDLMKDCSIAQPGANGRLAFTDDFADRRFRRIVQQLCAEGIIGECGGAVLIVNRMQHERRPIVVSLEVLPEDPPGAERNLLVTFTDSARAHHETRMQHLLQYFGLTPAEQRLARHLLAGSCLNAAARDFGLSKHTVRNQLRVVFAKLGVQRQADLIRLLLVGAGATG